MCVYLLQLVVFLFWCLVWYSVWLVSVNQFLILLLCGVVVMLILMLNFIFGVVCCVVLSRCRCICLVMCIVFIGVQLCSSIMNLLFFSCVGVLLGWVMVCNVVVICCSILLLVWWLCELLMCLKLFILSISRQVRLFWFWVWFSVCCVCRIRKLWLVSLISGFIWLSCCSWWFCDLILCVSCQLRMFRLMLYMNRNGIFSMIVCCEVIGW